MHLLPLLDFDSTAARWAFICLAILTIIYATMRPLFRKKDPLSKSTPAYASLARQRAVEQQMQNVLVEMSEMARQISAQLDTRTAKLEALIREADEKIAALGNAASTPPAPAPAPLKPRPAPLASELPISTSADQPILDPGHALVYALADKGRTCKEIAQELNRPSGEIELILALRR
jgi:hypothetical protein